MRFILDQSIEQWLTGRKRGETEIQKFQYLENGKSYLDEIKNIFHVFWRAINGWRLCLLIRGLSKERLVRFAGGIWPKLKIMPFYATGLFLCPLKNTRNILMFSVNIEGDRSSHQRCFIKKTVLKNFAKFRGKHLWWRLFLIKTPTQVFSCEYWEIFKVTYFEEQLRTAASEEISGMKWINPLSADPTKWSNTLK